MYPVRLAGYCLSNRFHAFMLRRRDWSVRDAPSCPPHSASEPRDSRLQQWTLAEARPVVVGVPVVLWCLLVELP